jgi:hypothetical protein
MRRARSWLRHFGYVSVARDSSLRRNYAAGLSSTPVDRSASAGAPAYAPLGGSL